MFFTLFGDWAAGGGGGAPKGLVHNLLMQLFTLDGSKIEVSETYFSDTMIRPSKLCKACFRPHLCRFTPILCVHYLG